MALYIESLGDIENDQMSTNAYGKIVEGVWLEIPDNFTNIQLDEYIIMSNHIHGIINTVVGAGPARPFIKYPNTNNLSIIIGSYKPSVSRQINKLNHNKFRWQRSSHDYIIRTSKHSLCNIRKYIINNLANWDIDENNIKNHSVKGQAGLAPTTQSVYSGQTLNCG